MNIHDCQRQARSSDEYTFLAHFPSKTRLCRWKDPYLGILQIVGSEGHLTVWEVDSSFPDLKCELEK